MPLSLAWHWQRFGALAAGDLYDALVLRGRVFVVEQACAYLDPDGLDRHSTHLLARDAIGRLVAYLRCVDPGLKYDEPSLGRIVTAPECRGQGLGRELMRQGLVRCAEAWPGRGIRISAQAHLRTFYAGFGFEPVGAEYLDDGIPHLEMFRSAR